MMRGRLSGNNGRSQGAVERRPEAGIDEPEATPGLGDVVRDAIDHVAVIVGDSIALGKLETKRMVGQVEQTAKDVVPRVVIGAVAAMFGFVGAVFALIAIFVALGEVIPSVAVRLAIYAAAFLVLAAAGGFFAARSVKEHRVSVRPAQAPFGNTVGEKGTPPAPTHPVGNFGE
jgi:hypothetical protein